MKLMTTTGTAKVSHFDHKSHRGQTYDLRGGDLKTRVRQFTSGLVRSRHAAIRAVLVVFAAVSISGVLLGPAAVAAVASGSDGRGAAHSRHGEAGERHDACDRERPAPRAHHHADVERPSDERDRGRICDSFPPPREHTPATTPVQGPPPPATPAHASTTPVIPAHPIVALRRPMVVTPRVPQVPIAQRPPLLAPPDLTVPVPGIAGAVSTSPVSIYVITLSTLVVATAIAIAALVLVRRSD
jgi:hypothetical protein